MMASKSTTEDRGGGHEVERTTAVSSRSQGVARTRRQPQVHDPRDQLQNHQVMKGQPLMKKKIDQYVRNGGELLISYTADNPDFPSSEQSRARFAAELNGVLGFGKTIDDAIRALIRALASDE